MAASNWVQKVSGLYASDHSKCSLHWIPKAGYSHGSKVRKFIGDLCSTVMLAEIPIKPVTTTTYQYAGKVAAVKETGVKLDPFEIEVSGNDFATFRALMGVTQSASTSNVYRVKSTLSAPTGHLLIRSYNPDTGACEIEFLLLDLQVGITMLPGVNADPGLRTYKLTFQSPAAKIYIADAANDQAFFVEGWYDNSGGAATDANTAWSGSESTVLLGTGNASYPTSTTPVALPIDTSDSSLSGYKAKLITASIDGVAIATSIMSFATSTMTFSPNYAAQGTSLLVIYVAKPSLYDQPNFSGDDDPTIFQDMFYGWPKYARN